MKKELKGQIIESISAQLKQYPNFYITDIAGLNAGQTSKLRRECFNEGVVLTVVKNTLFEHVLNGLEGEDVKTLCETLVGNTAIMYTHTNTPAAPARIIKKLQRDGFTKPVVKGAYVQDCVFIGEDKLDQLAAKSSSVTSSVSSRVPPATLYPLCRTQRKARPTTRRSTLHQQQPQSLHPQLRQLPR